MKIQEILKLVGLERLVEPSFYIEKEVRYDTMIKNRKEIGRGIA